MNMLPAVSQTSAFTPTERVAPKASSKRRSSPAKQESEPKYEAQLWQMADTLRGNMDAAVYPTPVGRKEIEEAVCAGATALLNRRRRRG